MLYSKVSLAAPLSTSKPLSTISLLTQVHMSHSPKRIRSLINWVRWLCWRIQSCECCNGIISFKSRKWVLSLWAICSEQAHHWPVKPSTSGGWQVWPIFFTLAPFFPSWRVITEHWHFYGPSRCAVAPGIIYSCIEKESIVIPAVIHLYPEWDLLC